MISETPGGLMWERDLAESEQGVGFFGNTIIRTLLILSVLTVLFLVGVLSWFIRPADNLIILHYSVYFGVDMLGAWWQAYLAPALAAAFLIAHLFLARYFYDRSERIAAYLLMLSAGWIAAGAFVSGASIAFINY